jgi:myo-inositol 2-dehydrogenase/D-chiro-inositol 1-dehydrogenase
MSERIGVALVGAGRIGLVHLNNILANQRFDLLYVVDAVETAAKAAAAKSTHAKPILTVDEALSDPKVKAIVICTPTAQHKEVIIKAARAKKAIMCEKPISLKVEEIASATTNARKKESLCCAVTKEDLIQASENYKRLAETEELELFKSSRLHQETTQCLLLLT